MATAGCSFAASAAVLAADFAGRFPACAACGPTPDGRLAVLVHGSATARVVGGEGELTLSAADAITSVNRLVAGPISAVRLELPGAGAANPLARLEAGVVSAAGLVSGEGLSTGAPARRIASGVEPGVPESRQAANSRNPPRRGRPRRGRAGRRRDAGTGRCLERFVHDGQCCQPRVAARAPGHLRRSGRPCPVRRRHHRYRSRLPPPPVPTELTPAAPEPLPVRQPSPGTSFVSVPIGAAGEAEPPAPMVDVRPLVLGLACSNGHLNDPSGSACITCGAPLAGQALREGPRPPLGVLALDDGSAFVLDTGYVLGREPQQDPEVLAGSARPLKITDADGVVSRRHVRVSLVGWDIQVVDLGSANGTFVQFPGDPHAAPAHRTPPARDRCPAPR